MRVLIVCLENWDTLSEMPFILKSAGCAVDVLCSKDSWLLSNSFYDKWIVRKNQQIEYINQIEEFLNTGNYDWIILADDAIIKQINDSHFNNQQLEKLLPISNLNYRSILSSKIGLSNFCFENKIASPAYVLYNNEADLDNIQSNIQFPVINKIDFSWGGANMFVSNDIESFKSNLHLLPLNQNTMIQEFMVGEEVPVEALFYKGELLEYMTSKILVFDKGPFSLSTKRLYYDNPDLKPLLKVLGKKLGITGFANMAYIKESSSGVYHLIEIDLRPNSWMAYGKFCNRDFSKALKQVLNTDTISQNESNNDFQSIEISLFFKEVRRSFWQNDLKSVLKWIFNFKHYWQFIPLYDLKLMKRIMRELGIILKQKITNLFNH